MCKERRRKYGCPGLGWCQQLPAPLLAGGGKRFIESLSWSPSIASPSGPIPLLVKGSCSFQHSRTKDSAGPYRPGACLFPSRFSPLPFHTFALFPGMGKVSSSNSLVAIDPIFQIKNWNMWSGVKTSRKCDLVARILQIFCNI